MNLPWRKAQPDRLRPIVLANLERLRTLFHARGRRFDFDQGLPTLRLENALWHVLDQTALDTNLIFPSNMPCEHRISEIQRALPPLHTGSGSGQWPSFLQSAK